MGVPNGGISTDILESVAIAIPCRACGRSYEVTLKQVALSHQMIHDGCPVRAETECPPLYYAPLVDPGLAKGLEEVWGRLEQEARAAGGELKVRPGL